MAFPTKRFEIVLSKPVQMAKIRIIIYFLQYLYAENKVYYQFGQKDDYRLDQENLALFPESNEPITVSEMFLFFS